MNSRMHVVSILPKKLCGLSYFLHKGFSQTFKSARPRTTELGNMREFNLSNGKQPIAIRMEIRRSPVAEQQRVRGLRTSVCFDCARHTVLNVFNLKQVSQHLHEGQLH